MGQCLLPSWQTIFMILLILLISFFFFFLHCFLCHCLFLFVLCYTNQIQYFLHLIYYHIRLVVVENRSDTVTTGLVILVKC